MKHLLAPHITEKAYAGISEQKSLPSTYIFKVNAALSKETVKELVEKEFKVSVVDVRIINLPGKARRFRGIQGRTSPIKKAVVRLKVGDSIAAFDIDTKKEKEGTKE